VEAMTPWSVKIDQSPDPAIKDLAARETTEHTIEDVKAFERPEAYRVKGTYISIGHRFGRLIIHSVNVHVESVLIHSI